MENKDLHEMKEAVDRIEACLTDDREMGRVGLVSKVKDHEKRIRSLERIGVYIVAGASTVVIAYRVLIDIWSRLNH